MVMLISWIMIGPSAVMMDCSFSSSICGLLALFSPCISGNVWISCWCETTYMEYQGQYPLMSGPEPCQENLFCRFSLYVDSCCVGREQPASRSAPASVSSASVFDRVIFSPLPCAQQELDLLGALRPFVLLDGVRQVQGAQVGLLRRSQLLDKICVFLVHLCAPVRCFLQGKLSLKLGCIEQVVPLPIQVCLDCSLLRRDIAWPDRIAFLVNAILIVELGFSKLCLNLCLDRQLGILEREFCIEDLGIGVIVHDRARDTFDILFDNAKRVCGVDKPLLALFSRLAAGERNVHVHQQRAVSGLVHLFCF